MGAVLYHCPDHGYGQRVLSKNAELERSLASTEEEVRVTRQSLAAMEEARDRASAELRDAQR